MTEKCSLVLILTTQFHLIFKSSFVKYLRDENSDFKNFKAYTHLHILGKVPDVSGTPSSKDTGEVLFFPFELDLWRIGFLRVPDASGTFPMMCRYIQALRFSKSESPSPLF